MEGIYGGSVGNWTWAALAATAPSLSSPDTNVAGALLRPTEALALCLMAHLMAWMALWRG